MQTHRRSMRDEKYDFRNASLEKETNREKGDFEIDVKKRRRRRGRGPGVVLRSRPAQKRIGRSRSGSRSPARGSSDASPAAGSRRRRRSAPPRRMRKLSHNFIGKSEVHQMKMNFVGSPFHGGVFLARGSALRSRSCSDEILRPFSSVSTRSQTGERPSVAIFIRTG